jgi:hypothetical protein
MATMETTGQVHNGQDLIDSRDVIERIAELSELPHWVLPLAEPEMVELRTLRVLADEASDYAEDWQYGATLIRDSYFEEYAQDVVYECASSHMDYTGVDFDGVTYWVR